MHAQTEFSLFLPIIQHWKNRPYYSKFYSRIIGAGLYIVGGEEKGVREEGAGMVGRGREVRSEGWGKEREGGWRLFALCEGV